MTTIMQGGTGTLAEIRFPPKPGAPSYDRRKFDRLDEKREQGHAAIRDLSERMQEQRRELSQAETWLRDTESRCGRTPRERLREDRVKALDAAEADVTAARAEYQRLVTQRTELQERLRPLGVVVNSCRQLIDSGRLNPRDVEPPRVTAADAIELGRDLEPLREKIGRLKAERDRVAAAAVPLKDAEKRLGDIIAAKGRAFDPNLRGLMRDGAGPGDMRLWADNAMQPGTEPDALLCAIFPEQVREALAARLRELYADARPTAMTPAVKAKKLSEIDGELLAIEIEEERIIVSCEAAGIDVARRADAEPAIILAVEPPTAKANAA